MKNHNIYPYSSLSKSFSKNSKPEYVRIFLKIDKIESRPNFLTTAFGFNILTNEYIAIRLNTVGEYISDLMNYSKFSRNEAEAKAQREYNSSSARESLADKRDKRNAKFLSFDNCILIDSLNGIPLYRSHWSELIPSNDSSLFFEGLCYLHVRDKVVDDFGKVIKREIAHLNIITKITTLKVNNFEDNLKALNAALTQNFKNGMPRNGHAIFEIIDNRTNELIAETFLFQKKDIEKKLNPNTGEHHNVSTPSTPEESIKEFIDAISNVDPNQFLVERDFLRALFPVFFNIKPNRNAFCQKSDVYLQTLLKLYNDAINGFITLRLINIHQVFIGAERKKYLIKNIDKGIIKTYTKSLQYQTHDGNNTEIQVRHYMPTFFVLHFHKDSGNPFVAYNIQSALKHHVKPSPLHLIPDDLFGIKYRKLN